ncbi:hypothetical protein AKJ53_00155 [candidate division MSBL1 archaeon SCGC-AAA382F02]|uniref:anthranilate synthase n=1 Tax=candidate division MSBL1 archaeon SCGC-AAA382F02 TaxID=1698282 RepID=A0A133VJ96_9EURY|nr:hypothetical protein AKJ53_00155 [candidate division MSBL1 archaeon SCGC-AAA382F02]
MAGEIDRPSLVPLAVTKDGIEDPAEVYLGVREKYDSSYLLESGENTEGGARYSVIGCRPLIYLKIQDGQKEIGGASEIVETSRERVEEMSDNADDLEILRKAMFMNEMQFLGLNLPRYVLGVTGYLGYDYIQSKIDKEYDTEDDLGHPTLEFALPSLVMVFDHQEKNTYYVALMLLANGSDFKTSYSDSVERLEELISLEPSKPEESERTISTNSNFEEEDFKKSVERIKEYIRAGDVIQTVISRRIDLNPGPELGKFYTKLREINSSPYMFFLDFPERSVVGSSPEALVRVQDRRVLTRPIAGTRRRGKNESDDLQMERDLIEDEKERAEHVMLVDLGRNDIGKVSKFGSVETSEFMEIEKYGDVQHIVSTVTGDLQDSKDSFDALRAVFPAGTVTGAPKVRAMEIIEELEPTRRGIYSGAVGTFSYTGDADFAITIRILTAGSESAQIQVGAGIVADSKPELEFYETENKARSLLRAAGVENEIN